MVTVTCYISSVIMPVFTIMTESVPNMFRFTCNFREKYMFGSSLLPFVLQSVHALFSLIVFIRLYDHLFCRWFMFHSCYLYLFTHTGI